MKKQIKKLNLNKETISNLSSSEMSKHVGGVNTIVDKIALAPPKFTKRCNSF